MYLFPWSDKCRQKKGCIRTFIYAIHLGLATIHPQKTTV